MQEAKADADPYINFCVALEDSVCKMAYEVIDHGDLAVGRWKHVALNYGSNGWGSSDMDIWEVQTSYVTAKIPSCTTLEKVGGCSACQECCKQAGKRSSCYKALRPMLDRLWKSTQCEVHPIGLSAKGQLPEVHAACSSGLQRG